ncbi:hypothetical protein [Streptomyces mirabilis]|uniref:Lipoprotein n=1 Tax=Streptomyces mirabilis TaxID=68239 RepID=A0ABU3UWC1_9ACTN|nr:hypothetical protein [Streptomyces mirabilis]MDU8998207.1 hypothetical protein [Streptomyces mirabilis]
MNRTATTAAGALLAALTLAGCSGSDPTPAPTTPPRPAQMLADLDGGIRDAASYQTVLDKWAPKCTQTPKKLAAIANAVVEELRKNGISDETEYSALVHLNASVPGGASKMDCTGIAAAYVTLREG